MLSLRLDVPERLGPLLGSARYLGAHGGRGSAKSHFFAEKAVIKNFSAPLKGVCIREVQESIKDSVKALIEAKIQKFGLGEFFEITQTEIRGANGSLMIFRGMQSYNAENIKSLEGFDWAWVEEAQTLSDISLRMLRPTLRNEGSELWFSWNPRHDTDAVDKLLRGPNRPRDALVVECNWQDNPWFPDVLRQEMEGDYLADPEMADHVWGGNYEIVSEGAYYARLLVAAEKEGRIGHYPYDPSRLVKTAWDIGVDDYTAVWFIQDNGLQATVIDYYETSGDGADDIISTALPETFIPSRDDRRFAHWDKIQALADLGRETPFKYGEHLLPHDIKVREWGAGARSRVETVSALGLRNIRKGVAANPAERIQAVRRLLPVLRFNQTPRVQLGLQRLRRYRRKWNDAMQTYTTPEHDENSHGCLVAGSKVTMADGSKQPVESIKAGQFVWTPSGNKRVLWSGFVKMSQDLIDIETTCGKRLTCTKEHKILSAAGFVEAGSLLPSMTIWTGHGWKSRLIGFLSRASGIGFRALITGERPTAGTISTGLFGKACTAKYRTTTTSTTKTATHSIIHRLIWNVYRSTITLVFTPMTSSLVGSYRHQAIFAESEPRSGTSRLLALSGILSTAKTHGKIANDTRSLVGTAAVFISRFILSAPCTARGSARIMRVNARKDAQSVFDLTVENAASYQAGGLYVSNSDALGEWAVNCGLFPPAPEKKPFKVNTRMPTLDELVKEHDNRRKHIGNRI